MMYMEKPGNIYKKRKKFAFFDVGRTWKSVFSKRRTSRKFRIMLIGFTQTACEFVIVSPFGRGNLPVKCCNNRRSTSRFPRRSAPRNDRLAVCLNNADKHIPYYITSVHFFGNCAGASRAFSHFCSQMTPSQRPILKPQFSKVEW